MSTHVLVGLFDDQINGVLTTSGTPPMSTITGNYVIRVPDDIPVLDYRELRNSSTG